MTEKTESIKWVVDTNFVYDGIHEVINKYDLVLMSTVKFELDKHKTASNPDLQYKARRANRFIFENYDKFIHDVGEYNPEEILGKDFSNDVMDYRILACAVKNGYGIITGDLNLYSTAKSFNVEVMSIETKEMENTGYTGVKKIFLETNSEEEKKFAQIYQDKGSNPFDLEVNQYIIFYDKEKPRIPVNGSEGYEVLDKFRWNGKEHVPLKLPEKKYIKAKNEEQECALDLLNNTDIPIKIIAGTVGSGKTFLGVKMSLYHVVEKGNQAKVLTLRQPIGTGTPIGYLKGDKEQKIEDFLKVFHQQMDGGEQEAEILRSRGQLDADIPYFIKGQTYTDTCVIVDEAEDLDVKQFRLIGTRLGENSMIIFTGDIKQAEESFKHNNGLERAIDYLKGNTDAGIVVLSEDIRSKASKIFADM